MSWFIAVFGWFFKAIGWLFDWPILFAKTVLHAIPWAATLVLATYVSYRAGGAGLAVFCALSILYMVTLWFLAAIHEFIRIGGNLDSIGGTRWLRTGYLGISFRSRPPGHHADSGI